MRREKTSESETNAKKIQLECPEHVNFQKNTLNPVFS